MLRSTVTRSKLSLNPTVSNPIHISLLISRFVFKQLQEIKYEHFHKSKIQEYKTIILKQITQYNKICWGKWVYQISAYFSITSA